MAFEERIIVDDHVCTGSQRGEREEDGHAFVLVLYTLFDRVRGSSKDGPPYLSVYGHESGEEAYFALWGL